MRPAYKEKFASPDFLSTHVPRWCDGVCLVMKAYTLNFGGRVLCASVKNFQLLDERKSVCYRQHASDLIAKL